MSVDLSGVTPTTLGNYSVAVANGTQSGLQPGLNDASNDLWDYSHADFENYAQTLAEARAVNGATMNSLGHSEAKLEASIQNLELAGGDTRRRLGRRNGRGGQAKSSSRHRLPNETRI